MKKIIFTIFAISLFATLSYGGTKGSALPDNSASVSTTDEVIGIAGGATVKAQVGNYLALTGWSAGADATYGLRLHSNTSSYTDCTSGWYGLNYIGGVKYECINGSNDLFSIPLAQISDWPAAVTSTKLGWVGNFTSDPQAQIKALSEVVSGYVATVPTYSDETCTKGTFSLDTSYHYDCVATNTWTRTALTTWNNPTPSTPTFGTFVIAASGTDLTATASVSTSVGAGGNGGVTLSCSTAGTVTATYSNGLPGTSPAWTLSPTVYPADTCTAAYTQPGNGYEGTSGGADVVTFSGTAVTNNSEASSGDANVLYYFNMDSATSGQSPQKGSGTVTIGASVSAQSGAPVSNALASSTGNSAGRITVSQTTGNIDQAIGTMGFYIAFQGSPSNTGQRIMQVASSPALYLEIYDASNLKFYYKNQSMSIALSNFHTDGTYDFLELTWDSTGNRFTWRINNGSWATEQTNTSGSVPAGTTIQLVNVNSAVNSIRLDQFLIADDYKYDLYAQRTTTSF